MIGKFRHRLTLQEPTPSTDAGGARNVSWTKKTDLWADMRDLSATESSEDGKIAITRRARITIRYRSDISETMRFAVGTRRFNIRAILDKDGTRRLLTCLCEEDPALNG